MKINKLEDVLLYHNVLKAICDKYEKDLKPYYDPSNNFQMKMWNDINAKLSKAKTYYDIVFEIMEDKVYSEIDSEFK